VKELAMLGRLNHVGVAVPSLEEAVASYRGFFGEMPISDVIELRQLHVRVRFLHAPNAQIELLEPIGDQGPIATFLKSRPNGGQHHLAFEVEDIHAAKADMEENGATVLGEPRIGAHGTLVVFVHPKDFCGVLIELMEPPGGTK
jgi:methylmalonyl-CoA/ethylmalonyl-CoA epimerase